MKASLVLKFLLFFPGTFLHELAHYLSAVILGKAEGFSVLPCIEGDNFVFGKVKSRTRYKVLSSFIASAPLIWWALLLLMLVHFNLLLIGNGAPRVDFGAFAQKIRSFSRWDLIYIWLFLQILWAGRLSATDIRNFAKGLLSVSGLLFLGAFAALVYFSKTFL